MAEACSARFGEETHGGGQPLGSEPSQLNQNRGSAYPADDVDCAVLVRVARHIQLRRSTVTS